MGLGLKWTPQVYAGDSIYAISLERALKLDYNSFIRHITILALYNCYDRIFYLVDNYHIGSEVIKTNEFKQILKKARKVSLREIFIKILSMRYIRKFSGPLKELLIPRNSSWIERQFPDI